MINQEMLKTMQFILEQQAQFATNMQRFEERQGRPRNGLVSKNE